MALTPLALLLAYVASALVEALVERPPHGVARAIVLLAQVCILTGLAMGLAGLVRRERLWWLPVIGWISTICIVGLLLYLDKDG